jgi:hypothetical protein
MGRNPQLQAQENALSAAQSSVARAVKEGTKAEKDLQKRGGKYRDWAGDTQGEMMGFLGKRQDPASYYKRIQGEFGPFMEGQQQKWQTQLNQGDYPVLGSPSHQRFEDTLVKSANMYDQYIKRGLDEVQPRFAAISKDPAFNLQYDPRAMQMAQGNINQDQVKRLTTWNV